VVVDDGQTLILGGLLKDQYGNDESQVPLLADIPVLGNLFKSRSRARSKTNLMVFLRPVVLRSQDASNEVTLNRYDYMRQRQAEVGPPPNAVLQVRDAPVMDPLKFSSELTMPSVRQPLDDPNAPTPTVVVPPDSRFAPKLAPQPSVPAGGAQ